METESSRELLHGSGDELRTGGKLVQPVPRFNSIAWIVNKGDDRKALPETTITIRCELNLVINASALCCQDCIAVVSVPSARESTRVLEPLPLLH